MCRDVYTSFAVNYDSKSPHYSLVDGICKAHQELEREYEILAEKVLKINAMTLEWDKYFSETRGSVQHRDELRKKHDHYDAKMEALVKLRNKNAAKNKAESARFIKRFERNELKYRSATENYVSNCNYTFNSMNDLIEYRTKFINPAISNFLQAETEFFVRASDLFRGLNNVPEQMDRFNQEYVAENCSYDPTKYIRGKSLLGNLDMRGSGFEKKRTFFTEDIKNSQLQKERFDERLRDDSYRMEGDRFSREGEYYRREGDINRNYDRDYYNRDIREGEMISRGGYENEKELRKDLKKDFKAEEKIKKEEIKLDNKMRKQEIKNEERLNKDYNKEMKSELKHDERLREEDYIREGEINRNYDRDYYNRDISAGGYENEKELRKDLKKDFKAEEKN